MLHITGSMKTLKHEVRVATALISEITATLNSIKPADYLHKRIGTFILQLSEFKVLKKDADGAKQILREVCSGEMSPRDAYFKLLAGYSELQLIQAMLDPVTF